MEVDKKYEPADVLVGSVWRHKKRCKLYTVAMLVLGQGGSIENQRVVIYRSHGSGEYYARSLTDLIDGRFEHGELKTRSQTGGNL